MPSPPSRKAHEASHELSRCITALLECPYQEAYLPSPRTFRATRSPAKTEGEQHNSQRLGTCCSQGSSLECRRVDLCQIQNCSRPRHIFREARWLKRVTEPLTVTSSRSSRSTPPCAPQVDTMAVTDAGAAHGVLMVISFIFLSEFAEVMGWYASNKVCGRSSLKHTRATPHHLVHQIYYTIGGAHWSRQAP